MGPVSIGVEVQWNTDEDTPSILCVCVWGGGGGQGGCERRSEAFVKIQKKKNIFFFFGGGGMGALVMVGRVGLGSGWMGTEK